VSFYLITDKAECSLSFS